ncbi:uncharacterized protein EAF01_009050 [Botrytis porri]|uniref:protein-tyrosine-phosphatase n=1 Tax=Botrytis porri TaxID=87229 RepID=A0A4Z1KR98_9HELO|nr:uncharacterized protein EAF01_009050 [Botrytis porri]KAF7896647.1 hypothetical protein EAF01_009050 [Botrytis porri]TGO84379.1 hypothetical protein BPOR_0512g00080 [Botrytis porri]
MNDVCEVIDESVRESRRVLVHCGLGISRSGTVVLGYVMRERALDREEALAFVRQKRSRVQPNIGFWEQLGIWHDCHYDVFETVDGEILEKKVYREWKVKTEREMSSRVGTLTQS